MSRLLPIGTASGEPRSLPAWRWRRPASRARSTVRSSFASDSGFSTKSNAPSRVASTAVSTVLCPDIITTGQPSAAAADHSRSSVIPSTSGIQMSSNTRSGIWRRLGERRRSAVGAALPPPPPPFVVSLLLPAIVPPAVDHRSQGPPLPPPHAIEGLQGVGHQVVEELTHAAAIGLDALEVLIQVQADARARRLRAVQVRHLGDELIQAEARDLHLRCARVFAEGVHHLLHGLHLLHDGARAALEDLGVALVHTGEQAPAQPLGGQLDGGEGILDLVRQAPCDLAPGGVALRLPTCQTSRSPRPKKSRARRR